MNLQARIWIGLGASILLASGALAQRAGPIGRNQKELPSNLPPIVRKALEVAPKLRYAAEMNIEFRGEGPSRTRFRQIVWKDGLRMRVERPDTGEIVVEVGAVRRSFNPTTNEIEEGRASRDEVLGRLVQALRMASGSKGKVTSEAGPTIAGRATEVVSITDAKGSIFQKIWIDVRSGMILKRELYDRVGSVAGVMEVTKIDYSPTFRQGDFEIRRPGAKVVSQSDLARRNARKHGFLNAMLPETDGYRLDGNTLVGRDKAKAWILYYQTQSGTISLVQSKEALEPRMLERMAGQGRSVYQWQYKGRNFALIGQTSTENLRTIAGLVQEK